MTARSVTPAAATIPLQPGGASLRTGAPARLKSVVKRLGAWRRLPTRRSKRRGRGAADRLGVRPDVPTTCRRARQHASVLPVPRLVVS